MGAERGQMYTYHTVRVRVGNETKSYVVPLFTVKRDGGGQQSWLYGGTLDAEHYWSNGVALFRGRVLRKRKTDQWTLREMPEIQIGNLVNAYCDATLLLHADLREIDLEQWYELGVDTGKSVVRFPQGAHVMKLYVDIASDVASTLGNRVSLTMRTHASWRDDVPVLSAPVKIVAERNGHTPMTIAVIAALLEKPDQDAFLGKLAAPPHEAKDEFFGFSEILGQNP